MQEPGIDPERLLSAVRPALERRIVQTYGEETELRLRTASTADVRVIGSFPEKATLIRSTVQGYLQAALEDLDAIDEG